MIERMTETEADRKLVGRPVVYQRPTETGEQMIVGAVRRPLTIEEVGGKEVVILVTIEGMIVSETIEGLPFPIEVEEPMRDEMVPVEKVQMIE